MSRVLVLVRTRNVLVFSFQTTFVLQRLIAATVELHGRIDCLVNNAGWRERAHTHTHSHSHPLAEIM